MTSGSATYEQTASLKRPVVNSKLQSVCYVVALHSSGPLVLPGLLPQLLSGYFSFETRL